MFFTLVWCLVIALYVGIAIAAWQRSRHPERRTPCPDSMERDRLSMIMQANSEGAEHRRPRPEAAA